MILDAVDTGVTTLDEWLSGGGGDLPGGLHTSHAWNDASGAGRVRALELFVAATTRRALSVRCTPRRGRQAGARLFTPRLGDNPAVLERHGE